MRALKSQFIPGYALAGLFALTFSASNAAWACASCGCSLSQDWESAGVSSNSGFKLDVRYDYLNQNQLRSGSRTISSAAASQIVNDGENQEVESYTKNDYVTASLDYTVNPDWGVNLQLPYIVRSHSTLGTESDGFTPGPDGGQYTSHTASLGDVKVVGRYLGLLESKKLSLQFGLKLPTGSHTQTGTSTDPGVTDPVDIDRGLQPGTGTTDLIVGSTYSAAVSNQWSYMVQGLFQTPLQSRDGYRPGNGVNVNVGLRYSGNEAFQPQLQLNIRHAVRDRGANADTVSTGGTLVYLSPGVTVPLNKRTAVYSYVQLPVYQHVNGVQLTPKYTASLGLRFAF